MMIRWSSIATKLPGRTDNEIKNYWNTHLRKKLLSMGIDPVTHRPRTDLNLLAGIPNLLAAAQAQTTAYWDINALRLQADAAKYQLLQGLLRALATPPAVPTVDLMALLAAGATNGGVSVSQPAAGVDHQQGTRAQYDGLLNLPALTSLPAATLPAMSSSFSGLLSSFGAGSALAGDGLSSTELGHSGASGSTAAMAPPPLVAAKECNDGGSGGTSTPCEDTPASSPFEGLENLNLDDEFNSDSWKDLLE